MSKKTLIILLMSISLNTYSQEIAKCYTTELIENELTTNPDYKGEIYKVLQQNRLWLANNNKETTTITIPIVVHVIYRQSHSNPGIGTNIPNFQIEDQIRILNEDYSKTNSEFPNPPRNTFVNSAGNPDLKFCLATTDPDGNSTTGITRTLSSKNNFLYPSESNDMKKNNTGGINGWPPSKYLNIWVCDLSSSGNTTVLGYAYLPGLQSWNAWKDGLVVDFQHFGTTGNASSSSDGRTPTHEVGHFLGLNHTFCESQSGGCCDNDDSNVYDTPATDDVYFGNVNANTNNNTCNDLLYGFSSDLLDMDENFMAYSNHTWMFSNDQVSEMMATLNGYRSNLKNSDVSVNCTGIVSNNNIDNKRFKIYPNPSNGKFIVMTENNVKIEILNILGNIIYQSNNTSTQEIDLSFVENGIYIININSDNERFTEKIIINR
jgi:hypothetical protein